MDEKSLAQAAREHGYSSDLCVFLDKLEKNLQLIGLGKYTVETALTQNTPEYAVVKIALANIGRAFSDLDIDPFSSEKSRNKYTLDDWIEAGEDEFAKHCTPDGRFRYGDFKYIQRPPYKPCGLCVD